MQTFRNSRLPRLADWLMIALILIALIALIAPQQAPVSLYKLSLVALAGVAGYYLDRSVFPYARPDGYLCQDWRRGTLEPEFAADYEIVEGCQTVFAVAMLRRAIIIGAAMIAIGLGA